MKRSGVVAMYMLVGGLVVGGYGATQVMGWEWGSAERTFVPADVRQAPGGYRSFHYWHRGYRGGK